MEKEKKGKAPAEAQGTAAAPGAAAVPGAEAVPAIKKPKKRAPAECIAHVRATFNNTLVNVTDARGNVVVWNSPGKSGFKGSRKSTPYAAGIAAEVAGKMAYDAGVRKVEVHIRGAGNGRESAVRALAAAGLRISAIKDFTAVPHNGSRPPKRRRV
ncbi:MAG: 30S ribosomal protein S11 [Chitinispirillaceae bacterium]|nr:30S ribosomal protein S11 [Chitinispirillaceae bacterium]